MITLHPLVSTLRSQIKDVPINIATLDLFVWNLVLLVMAPVLCQAMVSGYVRKRIIVACLALSEPERYLLMQLIKNILGALPRWYQISGNGQAKKVRATMIRGSRP